MDQSPFGTNYREKSWLDPRIVLGESPIHGKGLFAAEPFRVGEVLIVFGGSLFSREDIAAGKANNRTLMQVDENLWLGDPADHALGEDYFINHSCDPNLLDYGRSQSDRQKRDHPGRRGDHGLRNPFC